MSKQEQDISFKGWRLKPLILFWLIPVYIITGTIVITFNYISSKNNSLERINDHIVKRRVDITFLANLPSLKMFIMDLKFNLNEEALFLKNDINEYIGAYLKNQYSNLPCSFSVISLQGKNLLEINNNEDIINFLPKVDYLKIFQLKQNQFPPLPEFKMNNNTNDSLVDFLPIKIDNKIIAGIIYIYQIPVHELMKPAYETLVFNFILMLISSIVGLFIIYFILDIIIWPVNYLTLAAKKMFHGDFSESVYISKGCKEGKVLSKILEAMRLRIKKQIEQLQESERRYKNIFNNATEGIFQSTPSGRFLQINPALAKILGYDTTDEVLNSINDLKKQIYYDPEDRGRLLKLLKKNGTVKNFEHRFIHKDKSIHWASLNVHAVYGENGDILYIEGTKTDITKRKQIDEELSKYRNHLEILVSERTKELKESKNKAESAAKIKSEFLANMSHEIRTPMNGVIAVAELALDMDFPPKAKKYFQTIYNSSITLLDIINDILDFSKIEAGKLDIEQRPFCINDVMQNIVDIFINKTSKKNIEFLVQVEHGIPDILLGDGHRLQQILINLVGNAYKFTPENGEISIEVHTKKIEMDSLDLEFFVKDNGSGMTGEQLEKVFNSFTQADTSTTRKYGGTGLGLTICKQLVELMNGTIKAKSDFGKGSAFIFTIPFKINNFKKNEKGSTVLNFVEKQKINKGNFLKYKAMVKGMNVLLVEDNPTNQEIIKEILENAGIKVEIAPDGLIAINTLKKKEFDAVLMDIQMPNMDGFEATQKIRKNLNLTSLPIIAMTANAMKGDDEKCFEAGMDSYLAKPIRQMEIFKLLAEIRKNYISENNEIINEKEKDFSNTELLPDSMPGLNIKQAVERIGVNTEVYKRIIKEFVQLNEKIIKNIQLTIKQKDWVNLTKIAHTIKGGSASIGAYELQHMASRLEKEAKEKKQPGQDMLDDFEFSLNKVFTSIKALT